MNSSFTYPVVSYPDIINLFHAILFWRYEEKSARGIHPRFWFTTFTAVWDILDMGHILPPTRIERLHGKKELCSLFLKRTLIVEQWDDRDWDIILADGAFKHFCIRKGNRELTSGNTVNNLELCTRTRVFVTPFGIREAPLSVESVSRMLTHESFLSLWERYTAPHRENPAPLGTLVRERNKELDEEIWGKRAAEDAGTVT